MELAANLVDEGDVDVPLQLLDEPSRELPDDLAGFLRQLLDPHGARTAPAGRTRATKRPGDVRVADGYPTEFSVGVAQGVGAERQFGPFFLHRSEDDVVVGEIGGAFIDEKGTIEIGYAVVESHWNHGYATAAVEALVSKSRQASEVRRIVAHTPLERPQSGRVLKKAGFTRVREIEDADEAGNVVRVEEWQLAV